MPTLNATFLRGDGTPLSTRIRCWMPSGPGVNVGGSIVSAGVVMAETHPSTGAVTLTLEPGRWLLTWPDRSVINRLQVDVPLTPGEYDLDELVTGSPIISSPRVQWYDDVAEMLNSDSRLYASAVTRNSYDGDGIISGWSRVLKAAPEAAGLAASGDSVLEAADGHAFWVRNWIAS